jgi:fatty-acyl-CoA synthase
MPSIPDTLRTTAARCPDREALVFGTVRRTYRELYQEVERTAAALAAHGIAPGDRVLLISPNSDAFVIATYAVLRTGAILVPGNPRNAPPEVAHLVTDSGASTVLYAPELGEIVARGVRQSGASPRLLSLPELAGLATGEHPAVAHVPAEAMTPCCSTPRAPPARPRARCSTITARCGSPSTSSARPVTARATAPCTSRRSTIPRS